MKFISQRASLKNVHVDWVACHPESRWTVHPRARKLCSSAASTEEGTGAPCSALRVTAGSLNWGESGVKL